MKHSLLNSRANVLVILFILALTGCRTYGDYGTEEALFAQIQKVNASFESDLERVRAEQAALQRAAGQYADLKAFGAEFEELIARHEALIENHAELSGRLVVKTGALGRLSTSYRDLNRGLGAIVADQKTMRDLYEDFAQRLAGDDRQDRPAMSRYEIAPPFYERIHAALDRYSVSDAIDRHMGM